jgi:hypothetical protein
MAHSDWASGRPSGRFVERQVIGLLGPPTGGVGAGRWGCTPGPARRPLNSAAGGGCDAHPGVASGAPAAAGAPERRADAPGQLAGGVSGVRKFPAGFEVERSAIEDVADDLQVAPVAAGLSFEQQSQAGEAGCGAGDGPRWATSM